MILVVIYVLVMKPCAFNGDQLRKEAVLMRAREGPSRALQAGEGAVDPVAEPLSL